MHCYCKDFMLTPNRNILLLIIKITIIKVNKLILGEGHLKDPLYSRCIIIICIKKPITVDIIEEN